jgi:hypothetical protein
LKKGKAPGLSRIPPEALKAMDDTPQMTVHKHISNFFERKTNHKRWHKIQRVPVPKEGNLSDLNKWQGVMLMDMCSKVFSLIMTACAFKILDKHVKCFQFGGTPELGCRDGLFTLKALLNAQLNHDLASYMGFFVLVKAYNTANHTLLLCILEHSYKPPPKFVAQFKQSTPPTSVCSRLKGNSGDPPEFWCTTGRQHGASPISLPYDNICRNS